jgi:hypothetical protein
MIWSTAIDQHIVTAYGQRQAGECEFVIAAVHRDSGDAQDMVYSTVPESERAANARLIAAAPQLLAACECHEAMDSYDRDGSGFTIDQLMAVLQKHGVTEIPNGQSLRGLVRELRRAAIAAATQEPNHE